MFSTLKQFKERLIESSTINVSLLLNRSVKGKAYDLLMVNDFVESRSKEIINEIAAGKEKIEILPNPLKWFDHNMKLIEDEYEAMKTPIEEKKENVKYFCDVYISRGGKEEEFYDFFKVPDDHRDNFFEYLLALDEEAIDGCIDSVKALRLYNLNEGFEKLKSISSDLDYLSRESDFEKKETGISDLFIAYGFIEGRFLGGTDCRAPLGLLPVSLLKDDGKWYLLNTGQSAIEVNKIFLKMAFENSRSTSDKKLDFQGGLKGNILKQLGDFYESNDIEISDKEYIFSKFPSITCEDHYDAYRNGQLTLKRHLVLGRFPRVNAIYEDYEKLIDEELESNQIAKLLGQEVASFDSIESEDSNKQRLDERDYYFFSNMDSTQEEVLKKVNEKGNLVIVAPPGTGKRELVTNIVTDALAKDKRVLLVSQKRSQLDEYYNLLGGVKSKVALIHDADAGKKEFYNKVTTNLDEFDKTYKEFNFQKPNYEHDTGFLEIAQKIQTEATNIEGNLDKLKQIEEALYKVRENGLHLKDMYTKAWRKKSFSKQQMRLITLFNAVKDKLPELEYDYFDLQKFIDQVTEAKLLEKYTTFDEMEKSNKLYKYVQEEANFTGLEKVEESIEKVGTVLEEIKEKCESKHYNFVYEQVKNNVTGKMLDRAIEEYLSNNYSYLNDPVVKGGKRLVESVLKRKALKSKEENNRKTYTAIETECVKAKRHLETAFAGIGMKLNVILRVFNKAAFDELLQQAKDDLRVPTIKSFREMEKNYDVYLNLAKDLGEIDKLKIDFIKALVLNINTDERSLFLDHFVDMNLYDLLSNDLNQRADIKQMVYEMDHYEALTQATIESMRVKSDLTKDFIIKKWDDRFIKSARKDSKFNDFKREAAEQSLLRPIRAYAESYEDLLLDMFPCFLVSPSTASQALPLKEGLFDLVIYDGAGQEFLEDTIPPLFRGKSAVIIGDDKQLKPSIDFRKRYLENPMAEESDLNTLSETLFGQASEVFDIASLNFHKRSHTREMMDFFNATFYSSQLKMPANVELSQGKEAFEWIGVEKGLYLDGQNLKEAKVVVEKINEILKTRKNNETIGVITFNSNQRDAIYDEIETKRKSDPDFNQLIEEEYSRFDDMHYTGLFIKEVERVQGDVRDIIILSTAYAKNEEGILNQDFDALSQFGGESSLNVAISRARQKNILICSFEADDIDVGNTINLGPKRFKQYLQYVKAICTENEALKDQVMVELKSSKQRPILIDTNKLNLVFFIKMELEQLGYQVTETVGENEYLIDLAVFDPKSKSYILGIKCDGASYRKNGNPRERDIHTKMLLNESGWHVVLIWAVDWWRDSNKLVEDLKQMIDELLFDKESDEKSSS